MDRMVRVVRQWVTFGMALGLLSLLQPMPSHPAALAQNDPSPCRIEADLYARPDQVALGETVTASFVADIDCPEEYTATHIALVVDAAAGQGDPDFDFDRLRARLRLALENLDGQPELQVGVVVYADRIEARCALEPGMRAAFACLDTVEPVVSGASASDLALGIDVAREMLVEARAPIARPMSDSIIQEIMILVSDGRCPAGCQVVLDAARQAKRSGMLLMAQCASGRCDAACLRQAAISGRYFYPPEDTARLDEDLDRVASFLESRYLRDLVLQLELPEGIRAVSGSSLPSAEIRGDGRSLQWRVPSTDTGVQSFRVGLRPEVAGMLPLARSASIDLRDHERRPIQAEFEIPEIEVLASETGAFLPWLGR